MRRNNETTRMIVCVYLSLCHFLGFVVSNACVLCFPYRILIFWREGPDSRRRRLT